MYFIVKFLYLGEIVIQLFVYMSILIPIIIDDIKLIKWLYQKKILKYSIMKVNMRNVYVLCGVILITVLVAYCLFSKINWKCLIHLMVLEMKLE